MHDWNPFNTGYEKPIESKSPWELYPILGNDENSFVKLVDSMGDDLTVVNSARVSYGKKSSILDEKDHKLIKYLALHKHTSPFRHIMFQFHVSAPEFVARQWYKHVVGAGFTDHAWNEISGRYTEYEPKFYVPTEFRVQDKKNKQSSAENLPPTSGPLAYLQYEYSVRQAYDTYKALLDMGVCREQARAVLPLCIYTEFYWTVSLQALVNFIALRTHPGAQKEIQVYAEACKELAMQEVPASLEALLPSTDNSSQPT